MTTTLPRHHVTMRAMALLVLHCATTADAAPTYFIASDVLPAGLPILLAERANFHNAVTFPLLQEGFETVPLVEPIDYGPFTLDLISGNGFYRSSGNDLTNTEGYSHIYFETQYTTAVEFAFDTPINALGVDITSIDYFDSHISFLDSNGNILSDFAMAEWAGATFFGVLSSQAFSTARFEFGGNEFIGFDNLEFGAVPEPRSIALAAFGLASLIACAWRRRRI